MGQEKVGVSKVGLIIGNITIWACVLVSFTVAAGTFVVGGLEASSQVRNIFSFAIPFAAIIIVLTMLRRHVEHISERDPEQWQYSIILIVVAAIVFIVGIAVGTKDPLFRALYTSTYWPGATGVMACVAISIPAAVFRRHRIRSVLSAWLAFLVVVIFWTVSPLGDMIFPPVTALGNWIMAYVAILSPWWTAYFIGAAALVVRMMLMRERLIPY